VEALCHAGVWMAYRVIRWMVVNEHPCERCHKKSARRGLVTFYYW